jgi:hypothetical protein
MRVSLPSAAVEIVDENAVYPGPTPQDELAVELEQHIKETLTAAAPPVLAGKGEALKIHSPADETHNAERIRIPFADDKVRGFIFVRITDGTACVFFNGEHIETVDEHLSRKGVIIAALRALYAHLRKSDAKQNKLIAGELNKLTDSMADSLNDFPPGEPCEWPIESFDDEEGDDLNADGDVECAADGEIATDDDDLLGEPPAGDAAVEIVAIAEGEAAVPAEACGEEGVVEADDMARESKARYLFNEHLGRAKDRYVSASQYRTRLQDDVKNAKKTESELLDEVTAIENRGWQYFLPSKAKPAAAANEAPVPSIPSHESTLPPPEAPLSPQAGVSGANDSPASPAGGYHSDWQAVDIAALNLPKSLTTKLRGAGHDTIGKLEALRGTFEGLLSIAGVGRTKADAIEEALLGWLTKNRDSSAINEVREKNRAAMVAGESVALEMAAQGQ